jgi:hypothetical protein
MEAHDGGVGEVIRRESLLRKEGIAYVAGCKNGGPGLEPAKGGIWLVASRPGASVRRPRVELIASGESRTVGSGATADIVVPDRYMSRMHFRIRWLGGCPTIEDLASTNGTTINGIQVAGRLRVSPPSLVRAGMSEFSLFPAVATERGSAVEFGRVLGLGDDTAALFHDMFSSSMRQGPMARLAAWYVGMLLDRGRETAAKAPVA